MNTCITFSLEQLWLLNDAVRADIPQIDSYKFPPANADLNEEIALAIDACESDKLVEYTLELSHGDLIVLDSVIRRDMKHPDGAKGIDILRKVNRARRELAGLVVGIGRDISFKEAEHASHDAHDLADSHADSPA